MGAATNGPGRRGLLIGINQYPKFPPQNQLHGCVNDVNLMEATLRDHYGFPAANLTVLRDAQATRDAILAALDALVAATRADDVVVIQYSGHGSQVRDRERDEADGWDETIVPCDSGRVTEPNRDVTDDEIYLRLRALGQKTANITLLFDCCHSGTLTRDVFGGASRSLPRDERDLGDSPIPRAEWGALQAAARDVGPSQWLPLDGRYVLIAGCRDEESSYEYPPRPGAGETIHGTLTFFLHQELIKAEAGTTYRDVFERAKVQVVGAYPAQHPQIEGARDRELFGVRDFEPMRFVAISARAGNVVTLAAGAAHGITRGSKWAVYPQGTKQLAAGVARLGLVQISAVRGQTSDAQVVEAADAAAIAVNARVVEVEHDYGDLTLKVEFAPTPPGFEAQAAALAAELDRSQMVRRAGPEGGADARAYLLTPRTTAGPSDPVPQLPSIAVPTWAIVGGGGQLLMPPHALSEVGVTRLLCDNLEKIARYRNLLGIRNPDANAPLAGKVEFTLLRQAPDGRWEEALPDDGGRLVFRENERVAFRIRNQHTAPIFATVLDFGLTFGVASIYPVPGSNERHMKGVTVEFGVRDDQAMPAFIPEAFHGNEGLETLKLIATTQEVDFTWMQQAGVRSLKGLASGVEELLRQAGSQTRDVRPVTQTTEDWTTVERPFSLVRDSNHS